MQNKKRKELKILSLTLACWGLIFVGSGVAMSNHENIITKYTYSLNISQNKIQESKTNEIKLKTMTLEVNNPVSVNVKDYLENVEKIEADVLSSLKLDTSSVNIQEAGTYTYTISYKKKKYNGTFKITEKELPKVNITLKNLTLKKDSVLDTKLSTYINETLTEEVQKNIILDLSAVKTNTEGTYQYTVTYGNKIYTAVIEIYTPTPQPNVITPNNPPEQQDKTDTETENSSTTNNNQTQQ